MIFASIQASLMPQDTDLSVREHMDGAERQDDGLFD